MSDCLFCRIVSGEIATESVFDDGEVFAFKDIDPQAPIHILVIPKKHISSVGDLSDDDEIIAGRLLTVAARLAQRYGIADSGFRLVINSGEDGGQSVSHLHLHLLGGRRLGWPPG